MQTQTDLVNFLVAMRTTDPRARPHTHGALVFHTPGNFAPHTALTLFGNLRGQHFLPNIGWHSRATRRALRAPCTELIAAFADDSHLQLFHESLLP
jgi:hypothetical protein